MGFHRQNGPIRVLVVDDQPLLLSLFTQILRKEGYALATATDGVEALRIARAYPHEIHLLLSDVEMPGMSGIDLARQIVAERPGVRVLLTSGSPLPPGTTPPFLCKPFKAEELLERIRDVLGESLTTLEAPPCKRQSIAAIVSCLSVAAVAGIATWILLKKSQKPARIKLQAIPLKRAKSA